MQGLLAALNQKSHLIAALRESSIRLLRLSGKKVESGTPKPVHLPIIEEAEVEDDLSPVSAVRKGQPRRFSEDVSQTEATFSELRKRISQKPLLLPSKMQMRKRGVNSVSPPKGKSFVKTMGEKQMKRIFGRSGGQLHKTPKKKRSNSFEAGFGKDAMAAAENNGNKPTVDDRLNNSSALDYSTQYLMFYKSAVRKCKSLSPICSGTNSAFNVKKLPSTATLEDFELVHTIDSRNHITLVKFSDYDPQYYIMQFVNGLGSKSKFTEKYSLLRTMAEHPNVVKLVYVFHEKDRVVFISGPLSKTATSLARILRKQNTLDEKVCFIFRIKLL